MYLVWYFLFQAEDGIRDLVRSRGLGDVYKRQVPLQAILQFAVIALAFDHQAHGARSAAGLMRYTGCLLYTSDAADERSSVDPGGRRILKKKKRLTQSNDVHTPRSVTTRVSTHLTVHQITCTYRATHAV